MFEYKKFNIVTEPDYKEMIRQNKETDTYWCYVYDVNDTQFENRLYEFNMMTGFEFDAHTECSIENAIINLVDDGYDTIQLEICEKKLQRKTEILDKAFGYLDAHEKGNDLYNTLKEHLEMTDEEIEENGFDSLKEFFESESEVQESGLNLF